MSFDYEKYQKEQIVALGFNPDKLTENQKYILLEPIEAPENYHCDGEITPAQAKQRWTRKMKEAGFKEIEIMNVKKKMRL
jgi:hypothetical protein